MGIEAPHFIEVNKEVLAETKFNQLKRMIGLDLFLSDVVMEQNRLEYNENKRVSDDLLKVTGETRNIVRISMFNVWMDLVDLGSPLALQGHALMDLGRLYQEGQRDAVVGQNPDLKDELLAHLKSEMGLDYENTYIKKNGYPPVNY